MRATVARLVPGAGDDGPPILPRSGWSAWLVPLTAAAMAFLAVAALSVALAAGGLAQAWRADLSDVATVRLPAGADDAAAERVVRLLVATPGIVSARALDAEEQAALLAPFLGAGPALADLPQPRLLDLRLTGAGPDATALREQLRMMLPGAVYDDHGRWRAPLVRAAESVRLFAVLGALLVLGAAAGMMALAARANLAVNVEVVRVIRLIGGEDDFIARTFVRPLTARCLAGALGGTLCGVAALALVPVAGEGTGLAVALLPKGEIVALLALAVPGVLALAGWSVASGTVRLVLRELS